MKGELACQLLILLPLVASYVTKERDSPALPISGKGANPVNNGTSQTKVNKEDSLELAIRTIYERAERAKREASGPHRPYSAYRPLATSHRYRYPLNKKRAYFTSPDYSEDELPILSDIEENDVEDYEFEDFRPSLFRERVNGVKPSLINNAYFSNRKIKKNSDFNLEDLPLDWNKIYQLNERENNLKSPRNLPTIQRFLEMVEDAKSKRRNDMDENKISEYSHGLGKNLLMNRHKRDTPSFNSKSKSNRNQPKISTFKTPKNKSTEQSGKVIYTPADSKQQTEHHNYIVDLQKHSGNYSQSIGNQKKHNPNHLKIVDRHKRAFLTPYDDERSLRERENDFLTREYFKTIARSVGNKKKRMAPVEVSEKRTVGFDSLLENPSMLHYVQDQIKETEEEVVEEAEELLQAHPPTEVLEDAKIQALLSNSITKLDALEGMRESLSQLEHLQEEDSIRKRALNLAMKQDAEKEKRRKDLNERHEKRENRRKRNEDVLEELLGENESEECPVLEGIVTNCLKISELVGDGSKVFLEPCLRHEICYMCGSGLQVSRHECDALLSSALEVGCSTLVSGLGTSSLDCLSGAGDTFNSLADPNRYDEKGVCTYDPCVRQLLDSR